MKPESERNYFDVLRLIAAIAVVISHFFLLYGHDEPGLRYGSAHGCVLSLGTMGVTLAALKLKAKRESPPKAVVEASPAVI